MNGDSRKKILIIDDDSRNVFALSAVLRARGFSCVSAPGGEEALTLLNNNSEIGIVLTDMMMPDMDGYTLIPAIRKIADNAGTPIVAVTAQAMPGDRERCLAAGADEYLSKPINVDELLEILNTHLS